MEKLKRIMQLQQFSEGGEGGEGGQSGAEGGDGGTGGADGGQGQAQQPFATFPDEKSFMSRVDREAKKRQGDFLKELGLEDAESLKAIVNSHKQREEDSKTELEKLREQVTKAENDRLASINKSHDILRRAEAKITAANLEVKPERVDRFLQLLDLTKIEVKDGAVDSEALNKAITELLEEMPEFKVAKETTPPPAEPSKGGGKDFENGGTGGKSPLTMEAIKAMSPQEVAENIVEIREFMAKNQ